jgi:hypothetical protein
MLNKELSHFSESSKSGNQISEYICSTFLGKYLYATYFFFLVDNLFHKNVFKYICNLYFYWNALLLNGTISNLLTEVFKLIKLNVVFKNITN